MKVELRERRGSEGMGRCGKAGGGSGRVGVWEGGSVGGRAKAEPNLLSRVAVEGILPCMSK